VATSVGVEQQNVARVYGTTGWIEVPQPWSPATHGQPSKILVHRPAAQQPEEITFAAGDWLYALEADVVARNLARRQAPSPAMSWDDTLGNLQTLDRWREAIGLRYDSEG
jgi:predicted dehydrogenase